MQFLIIILIPGIVLGMIWGTYTMALASIDVEMRTLTEQYQQLPELYDTLATDNLAIACKQGKVTYQGSFKVPASKVDPSAREGETKELLTTVNDVFPSCLEGGTYAGETIRKDAAILKMHAPSRAIAEYREHHKTMAQQAEQQGLVAVPTRITSSVEAHPLKEVDTSPKRTEHTATSRKVKVVSMSPPLAASDAPEVIVLEKEISGQ